MPPAVTPVALAPVERDWLATACPYLQSEDGSPHSNEPHEGHRCAAQDPPGTVPPAFQERFCLTDRHPRCEMYKYAGALGSQVDVTAAALSPGLAGTGEGSTRFRFGRSAAGEGSRRPAIIAAAGIAGVVVVVFLLVLLLGSCGGEPGAPGDPSPGAGTTATPAPAATPGRSPLATPDATPAPAADETSQPGAADALPDLILYEVQDGEGLLKIGEAFGTSRRSIIKANAGMEDQTPYVQPGDLIVVPVSPELTIEQLEAQPGYRGPAP